MGAEAEISRLKIVTETQSSSAVNGLKKLAAALKSLQQMSDASFKGLENAATSIKSFTDSIHKIRNSDITKLERLAGAAAQLRHAGFSSAGKAAASVKAASIGGGTGTASRGNGGRAPSLPSAGGGGTGAGKAIKDKFSSFGSSILRIATYRLIRTALKEIAEAYQEGYQNAVEWSRLNNTALYPSVQKIATASLVMKNQLGAAGAELIQTIQPALVALLGVVTDIAEQFAQMFAFLGGRGTYMRAKRDIDGITASQKKLNNSLLAFDEINKLNGNNPYGNVSISDMFEEVAVAKDEASTFFGIVTSIGGAIAAWKIGSLISGLTKATAEAKTLAAVLGGGEIAGAGALTVSGAMIGLVAGAVLLSLTLAGISKAELDQAKSALDDATKKYKETTGDNAAPDYNFGGRYGLDYGGGLAWSNHKNAERLRNAANYLEGVDGVPNYQYPSSIPFSLPEGVNMGSKSTLTVVLEDSGGNKIGETEIDLANEMIARRTGRSVAVRSYQY